VVKVPGALLAEKVTTVPFVQVVGCAPLQKSPLHLPEIEIIYIGWNSILTTLADANRTSMTNTYCMYTVLRYS